MTLAKYMITERLAKKLSLVADGHDWTFGDFRFSQPRQPVSTASEPLKRATIKDFKLAHDKIRLNTWNEDVKFELVTPGTYLEFDDVQVKFVTK